MPSRAQAQNQVVVDWQAQKLVSFPQIVSQRMASTIVVQNVNDLLYQYKIDLTPTPRAIDDASSLLAIAAGASGANQGVGLVPDSCTTNVAALNNKVAQVGQAVAEVLDPNRKDTNGKYRTLQQVITEWNTRVKTNMTTINGDATVAGSIESVSATCTGDELTNMGRPAVARAQVVQTDVATKQRKVDGQHQIEQAVSLDPETDYQITVTEQVSNGLATGASFSAKFSPSSHLLTLSLGTLLTSIQQRSYSTMKDPSNTAQNLLSVSGTGKFSPLGVALLNYECPKFSNETIGATISSGLVLRFGSSTVSASSFGWFGGGGIHIYHRLFVAAGIHVGEFSDFPIGLGRGSVVPANYGNASGVNRSTTRFAFTITYQTKKFSSGSTAAKTTSTAPAAQ